MEFVLILPYQATTRRQIKPNLILDLDVKRLCDPNLYKNLISLSLPAKLAMVE
jgi:hypothetical protein